MMETCRLKFALIVAVIALASCKQAPQPASGDAKTATPANQASAAAQPVSGKKALWAVYKSAHGWAKDLAPLALASKSVPGIKNAGGNAAMWTATFGSPSKHEARIFTYSVASHSPDIYKGVTIGNPIPWNGPTSAALPFATSDDELVLDSDAAYKTASEQATRWLKQHPDQELTISLGNSSRFPGAVWYLQWGDKKSGYAAYVNAKSGTIVK